MVESSSIILEAEGIPGLPGHVERSWLRRTQGLRYNLIIDPLNPFGLFWVRW